MWRILIDNVFLAFNFNSGVIDRRAHYLESTVHIRTLIHGDAKHNQPNILQCLDRTLNSCVAYRKFEFFYNPNCHYYQCWASNFLFLLIPSSSYPIIVPDVVSRGSPLRRVISSIRRNINLSLSDLGLSFINKLFIHKLLNPGFCFSFLRDLIIPSFLWCRVGKSIEISSLKSRGKCS